MESFEKQRLFLPLFFDFLYRSSNDTKYPNKSEQVRNGFHT